MEHYYQDVEGWCTIGITDLYDITVVTANNNARFVEIGALYGQSSVYMAVNIINSGKNIKFDVIDTFRGSPEHQLGASAEDRNIVQYGTTAHIYLKNIERVKDTIRTLMMESKQAVDFYNDNSIDFIFIDGNHEAVKEDILLWWPKVKKDGIMSGHDALFPNIKQDLDEIFRDYSLHYDCWMVRKLF